LTDFRCKGSQPNDDVIRAPRKKEETYCVPERNPSLDKRRPWGFVEPDEKSGEETKDSMSDDVACRHQSEISKGLLTLSSLDSAFVVHRTRHFSRGLILPTQYE